jgi:hypothetical protein
VKKRFGFLSRAVSSTGGVRGHLLKAGFPRAIFNLEKMRFWGKCIFTIYQERYVL